MFFFFVFLENKETLKTQILRSVQPIDTSKIITRFSIVLIEVSLPDCPLLPSEPTSGSRGKPARDPEKTDFESTRQPTGYLVENPVQFLSRADN